MPAERLQADHRNGRLLRPCHEEVLKMQVGQILRWKVGGSQQRNDSGKRWSSNDRHAVHDMAQAAVFALRGFAMAGAHGAHSVALPQQFSVRYPTSAVIAPKSAE